MKNITIIKNDEYVDFTEHLNELKLVRNRKRKTYKYVAKLNNYINAKEIEKEFYDVANLTDEKKTWAIEINSLFLDDLKKGDIFEIGVNFRESSSYSLISKNYFLVIENNNDILLIKKLKTPYLAFREKERI